MGKVTAADQASHVLSDQATLRIQDRKSAAKAKFYSTWRRIHRISEYEDIIVRKLGFHGEDELESLSQLLAELRERGHRLNWSYIKKWAKAWGVEKYLKPFLPTPRRNKATRRLRRRRSRVTSHVSRPGRAGRGR